MQAIILAAGMGKRLKELTSDNTKCMVKVNGVTIIERMLGQLEKYNLTKIVIVVGYKAEKLIEYVGTLSVKTRIVFVENKIYDRTNNIYSLALAKDYLMNDDTLLLESDLIFEDSVIEKLVNDSRETLALVDKYESWMDGTCVKLSSDDGIESFVNRNEFSYEEKNRYYKTVNIYKFSKRFSKTHYVPFLNAYQEALGMNEYYEQVLRVIAMLGDSELKAKKLNGEKWYEIDDIQDLDIAESIFVSDEEKRVELLQERYGGYWRYPKLVDFCYLVNPYFPPKKLIEEMKASFEILLTQYPSGMHVNSLLAAKNFDVKEENIVVGNGAAELIKSVMGEFRGKLGIICPTVDEYSHRYAEKNIVEFWPSKEGFRYTAADLISFFGENTVENLILINPDNPTGNYLQKDEIIELICWTKKQNIKLVVDESFADFADEQDSSIIDKDILEANPHLYVIKSISKSHGVPGIRLGVLASGNLDVINRIKKDVAIWNINSFGEFYLQIAEKYKSDYSAALEIFSAERKRLKEQLEAIDGLRVFPSQANFFMVEILNGMSAKELTRRMIVNHSILIKNLFSMINHKHGQFIRLAIKGREENDKLIKALKSELM